MPKMPPRPCTHPGCTRYADRSGRCAQHQRKAWDHGPKTAAVRGYGRDWQRLREKVMQRDGWLCQEHKRQGILRTATDCDHIVPKAQGGTDDMDNLQALCKQCHNAKSKRERGNKT